MVKFICLSGKSGSGKDTTANILRQELERNGNKVLISHYADLVKYTCKTFLGWNGEKDNFGRGLLQHVGTDIVRKQDADYWVRYIADMATFLGQSWDYIIMADTRFYNEIFYLCERGFDVKHIRICRDEFESSLTDEQKQHASETSLDDCIPDYYLMNNSFEDLRSGVETLCADLANDNDLSPVQISLFEEDEQTETH